MTNIQVSQIVFNGNFRKVDKNNRFLKIAKNVSNDTNPEYNLELGMNPGHRREYCTKYCTKYTIAEEYCPNTGQTA